MSIIQRFSQRFYKGGLCIAVLGLLLAACQKNETATAPPAAESDAHEAAAAITKLADELLTHMQEIDVSVRE